MEREYRGADHLGQRGARWNQSNYVNQHLHRRDVAVAYLLSTAVGPAGPSAPNHKAEREATRRGDVAYGSRSITFTRNGAMEGYNGWKSSVAVTSAELDARNRDARARETSAASEKMLKKTGYLPPWKVEERKMATMRELKAKGHWPEPPPPVEVLARTRRAKTTRADVLAVLELDDFVAPADEEERRGKRRW